MYKYCKSIVKLSSIVKIAKIAPSASIVYQFLVFLLWKLASENSSLLYSRLLDYSAFDFATLPFSKLKTTHCWWWSHPQVRQGAEVNRITLPASWRLKPIKYLLHDHHLHFYHQEDLYTTVGVHHNHEHNEHLYQGKRMLGKVFPTCSTFSKSRQWEPRPLSSTMR